MKRTFMIVAVAACTEPDTTPPWQLDHDRIVAIRSNPPGLAPGEVATLDALLAHAGGPTTTDAPRGATAAFAPGGLFTAVHFNVDHWQIDGPDQDQLDLARAELGLDANAPVPLEVSLQFGVQPLYATKIVMLGEARENPVVPEVQIDGVTAGTDVTVDHEVELLMEAGADLTVRWLTSCGKLTDDESRRARLAFEGSCDGELVIVIRDGRGGASWQVWPLRMR